jgi:hypothetical protein
MSSQLAIPIAPELMMALAIAFAEKLEKRGSPEGTLYRLTNPVRFAMLRSRQTVDVSVQTSPSQRQKMFLPLDEGLATPIGGPDVLTDEPVLQYGVGISEGYAFGVYGMFFETDSAGSTPANSRLTQRAMRGAYAKIERTNRTLLGPYGVELAGDPVNRNQLVDGGGTTLVDAGVVAPDLRTTLQPNPLVIFPRDEVKPEIGYNGTNFAAFSLTEDFQLVWTLLAMVADVEAVGLAPARDGSRPELPDSASRMARMARGGR